ncbi:copper homeostasis periplasmic binding protein CopC [Sphingomonas sp. PWP1-2]|uniref:copper homeostasis periplasmic binding protein CopC n=1 Tax=Sphingomonas sp. PWP1-2 TaxID=2804558 RepID=UPI003CF7A61F
MYRKTAVALFAAATLFAGVAQAHPKLLSSTPAAKSTGAAPRRIELHFSEGLMAKLSGADLAMTSMPGMAMKTPMKMAGTATVGADGKTLFVLPAKPLPKGTYRVDYHVVSVDTHRVTGTLVFRIS